MRREASEQKVCFENMNDLSILDCTLRDGGYVNQWQFGENSIVDILEGLAKAKVEIVECGFLTNTTKYNKNITLFNQMAEMDAMLPAEQAECMYVCLMNLGEYNVEDIPPQCETRIQGIRVTFHKQKWKEALVQASSIKEKGYKVFLQPMVSLSYSDEEFLALIRGANQLEPYAFYIVDSFGVMKRSDLIGFFILLSIIWIGI